jgi:hypothetical protein
LSFLPPESRAALNDLAIFFNTKIAKLIYSSSIETERFRHAQGLDWCQAKLIPDPCGNKPGYGCIVACFGQNLIIDCHLRSATIAGYVLAIKKLFELRNYPIPANLGVTDNMMSKIIHAREREENIVRHQSPLTKEMYNEMGKCTEASSPDFVDSVLFDFFNLISVSAAEF